MVQSFLLERRMYLEREAQLYLGGDLSPTSFLTENVHFGPIARGAQPTEIIITNAAVACHYFT